MRVVAVIGHFAHLTRLKPERQPGADGSRLQKTDNALAGNQAGGGIEGLPELFYLSPCFSLHAEQNCPRKLLGAVCSRRVR